MGFRVISLAPALINPILIVMITSYVIGHYVLNLNVNRRN